MLVKCRQSILSPPVLSAACLPVCLSYPPRRSHLSINLSRGTYPATDLPYITSLYENSQQTDRSAGTSLSVSPSIHPSIPVVFVYRQTHAHTPGQPLSEGMDTIGRPYTEKSVLEECLCTQHHHHHHHHHSPAVSTLSCSCCCCRPARPPALTCASPSGTCASTSRCPLAPSRGHRQEHSRLRLGS